MRMPYKPKNNIPYELISKTIDLIQTHGWYKKYFGSCEQGFCVMGALLKSREDLKASESDLEKVEKVISEVVGRKSIPYWNDYFAKNEEVILTKLRIAQNKIRLKLSRGESL